METPRMCVIWRFYDVDLSAAECFICVWRVVKVIIWLDIYDSEVVE